MIIYASFIFIFLQPQAIFYMRNDRLWRTEQLHTPAVVFNGLLRGKATSGSRLNGVVTVIRRLPLPATLVCSLLCVLSTPGTRSWRAGGDRPRPRALGDPAHSAWWDRTSANGDNHRFQRSLTFQELKSPPLSVCALLQNVFFFFSLSLHQTSLILENCQS